MHQVHVSMDSLSKGLSPYTTSPATPESAVNGSAVEYNVELQANIRVGHNEAGDTHIATDADLYSGNDSPGPFEHYRQFTATYTEPDDDTDTEQPRHVISSYDNAFDAMGRTNKSIGPLEESHDMEYDEMAAGYTHSARPHHHPQISAVSTQSDDLPTPRPREHVAVHSVNSLSLRLNALDIPKRKYRASDPNIEPVDYDSFRLQKRAEIASNHHRKYRKYEEDDGGHHVQHSGGAVHLAQLSHMSNVSDLGIMMRGITHSRIGDGADSEVSMEQ